MQKWSPFKQSAAQNWKNFLSIILWFDFKCMRGATALHIKVEMEIPIIFEGMLLGGKMKEWRYIFVVEKELKVSNYLYTSLVISNARSRQGTALSSIFLYVIWVHELLSIGIECDKLAAPRANQFQMHYIFVFPLTHFIATTVLHDKGNILWVIPDLVRLQKFVVVQKSEKFGFGIILQFLLSSYTGPR